MPDRIALIIASYEYEDASLRQLAAPARDAEALAHVLSDPTIGTFDQVETLVNPSFSDLQLGIADFFAEKKRDDLLLLYFSGHGILDDQGRLYLAMKNTLRNRLSGSAIAAKFITEEMDNSRSKRQVLILDCCHSGAFAKGTKSSIGAKAVTRSTFEGSGYGKVVLTATDAIQYAWEGDQVIGTAENSLFTHFLLEGLRTGAADTDSNGLITLNEWYDYAYEQVVNSTSRQKPRIWMYSQEGKQLVIARNPRSVWVQSAQLPLILLEQAVYENHGGPELEAENRTVVRAIPDHTGSEPKLNVDKIKILIPKRAILIVDAQYNFVPKGTFPMGSDHDYPHEQPRHPVTVSSFFMAATPVTNIDFDRFVKKTRYITTAERSGVGLCLQDGTWKPRVGADWRHPMGPGSSIESKAKHPAVQVSWYDARAYCDWLTKFTSFQFDLPTEAEWEYAAGGTQGYMWSFGDTFDHKKANLEGTDTSQVGNFLPNEFGLYDMTGNVYEWCSDWYAESWIEAGHRLDGADIRDPIGPSAGQSRVLRGGSWFDEAKHGRNANRFFAEPYLSAANWGFRASLRLTDELLIELLKTRQWGMTAQQMM